MNVGGHWPTKIAASFFPNTRRSAESAMLPTAAPRYAWVGTASIILRYVSTVSPVARPQSFMTESRRRRGATHGSCQACAKACRRHIRTRRRRPNRGRARWRPADQPLRSEETSRQRGGLPDSSKNEHVDHAVREL